MVIRSEPFLLVMFKVIQSILLLQCTQAFFLHDRRRMTQASCRPFKSYLGSTMMKSTKDDNLPSFELPEEVEAEKLKKQSEMLRQQIREMEEALEKSRKQQQQKQKRQIQKATDELDDGSNDGAMTLRNKRVLVAGANGRLGSLVCRYLLRNHPEIGEVVAAVHVVSENSPTSRGYGRLSYEVGAEDGIGTIGPAWSSTEDRIASFQFNGATMGDYNLNKIRIVECELLDPIQCNTICENVDTVIWCATDFNGNIPRAVSGLNVAFLFRAIASPLKGRVEIEGVQNMLGALKLSRQEKIRRNGGNVSTNDPVNFVLVSMVPEAYGNYETPFGEFNGLKRQAEQMVRTDFPSLTHCILQMGQFEDNFISDGETISIMNDSDKFDVDRKRRLIHRRDAAKAIVDSLINPDIVGRTVQVFTTVRPGW
jgi:nucleoside-diphosphate-sugar epimerase